jgi:hypothetical protein
VISCLVVSAVRQVPGSRACCVWPGLCTAARNWSLFAEKRRGIEGYGVKRGTGRRAGGWVGGWVGMRRGKEWGAHVPVASHACLPLGRAGGRAAVSACRLPAGGMMPLPVCRY